MDISVVIPAYTAGRVINDLFLRIKAELSGKYSFEVLFIFDKGTEDTQKILESLEQNYPDLIRCFYLSENYGQHKAIQFGFSMAEGNYIITMDEDLQHDPADITRLILKQKQENYDIVYGKFNNLQHKGIRNSMSTMSRKILKLLIPKLFENYSPYRLIRHDVAVSVSTIVYPYTFIDDYLSRITNHITYEGIDHYKRSEGKSAYNAGKLIINGIYILLAYTCLVSWLLTCSLILLAACLTFFLIHLSQSNFLNGRSGNNTIIIITFVGAGILFFLSLLGSHINHLNVIKNSKPVKYYT